MADIKRVNPGNNQVQAVGTRRRASSFGGGVGEALQGLSQSVASAGQTALNLEDAERTLGQAYTDRQDKLDLTNAQAALIKLEGELSRDLTQMAIDAPEGAPGLTDQTAEYSRSKLAEFNATLSERSQQALSARIATIHQNNVTTGFNAQISAENNKFTLDTANFVNGMSNGILEGAGDPEEIADAYLQELEALYAVSPLDAASSALAYDRDVKFLKTSLFTRLSLDEANGVRMTAGATGTLVTENGLVRGDKNQPVAAGLSRTEVGVLNAIAGPESGGVYNAMYTPEGSPTRTFSDFSAHPNSPAVISSGPHKGEKSTAAGKYQMIYPTWMEAKNALGLPDFSPESQDRAAVWLAKRDYAKKSGGSSLDYDLKSGDPQRVEQVRLHLSATWEGLKNLNPTDFFNKVAEAQGTPSALLRDERFADLSYDLRAGIMQDAQTRSNNIQNQMMQERDAETAVLADELTARLLTGEAGLAEITKFVSDRNLNPEQEAAFVKTYREVNANAINAQAFAANPADQSEGVNDRRAAYASSPAVIDAINSGDTARIQAVVVEPFGEAGHYPAELMDGLVSGITASSPEKKKLAFNTLSMLMAEDGLAFDAAVDETTAGAVAFYDSVRQTMPEDAILDHLSIFTDPSKAPYLEHMNKLYTESKKDYPIEINAVASDLGSDTVPDTLMGAKLFAEYEPLYRYQFTLTGDPKAARKNAVKLLSARWGSQENLAGQSTLMKYAPSSMAPPYMGSTSYINDQLAGDLGLTVTSNESFRSDAVTEAAILTGEQPTWQVMIPDASGQYPRFLRNEETPAFERQMAELSEAGDFEGASFLQKTLGKAPVRWHPEITTEMQHKAAQVKTDDDHDKFKLGQIEVERARLNPDDPEYAAQSAELDQRESKVTTDKFFRQLGSLVTGGKSLEETFSMSEEAIQARIDDGTWGDLSVPELARMLGKTAKQAKEVRDERALQELNPTLYNLTLRQEPYPEEQKDLMESQIQNYLDDLLLSGESISPSALVALREEMKRLGINLE